VVHEALHYRVEPKDLRRCAVAAGHDEAGGQPEVRPPWPATPLARKAWTHRPSPLLVQAEFPGDPATVRPVLITSFTTSTLFSGVSRPTTAVREEYVRK